MHFLHSAFLIQFLLSEDIPQMPRDDRLIPLKQLRHLRLGQPDSFLLQADLEGGSYPSWLEKNDYPSGVMQCAPFMNTWLSSLLLAHSPPLNAFLRRAAGNASISAS